MNLNSKRWFQSALVGLGLATSINLGLAVPDKVLGTFDSALGAWGKAWGSAAPSMDWSQDNTGNGGGACYITGDFGGASDGSTLTVYGLISGNPWWHPDPSFDMTLYQSVEFDIKWDAANSTLSVADFNTPPLGGEGGIVIWSRPDTDTWVTMGTVTVPAAAATGWAHISLPIDPKISNLGISYGIALKKWVDGPQRIAGNTFAFWIDNVILKGSDAPPPPPLLSLAKPIPGMNFIAASGGQYDRQTIRTVGSNYTWVGASGPVSYSFDLAKLGDPTNTGFNLVMYFTPGIPDPTRPDSDWHENSVLSFAIGNNANGSAYSTLRYKTNAVESNGHLYDTGTLGGPGSTNLVGTWTLTFQQDINVTITSPDGSTFATNLPPEVIDIFKQTPNMQISIGGTPGSLARLGQSAIVKRIKFTGVPGQANIDTEFINTPMDTNIWFICASSAKYGVQQILPDAIYWVDWTLPSVGYGLQTATSVNGPWTESALAGFDAGPGHNILVSRSDLPGSSSGYFRLIKRVASKLQILLPGETNAPGTATGKIGTPMQSVDVFAFFDVTVNAVDDTFHIVKSANPKVHLSSTDPGFSFVADQSLANGTYTFTGSCYFGSLSAPPDGQPWTITVTDTAADNPLAPATSSAVTAKNPTP